jgi:hypothetical protein
LPRPEPKQRTEPKLEPEERFRDVTESAEESGERRKAENAQTPEEKAAAVSAHNLREFQYACNTYLPKLNEADLKKAHAYFIEICGWKTKPKKDAA